MIRVMTLDDMLWLEALAVEFNDTHWDQPVNRDKLWTLLQTLVTTGVALRTDKGAIVGSVYDDPIRDYIVLVELGWYSTGRDGFHLLDAFVAAGKERGVDEIRMSTLESNKRAVPLLTRRGFTPLETSHSLRLGD